MWRRPEDFSDAEIRDEFERRYNLGSYGGGGGGGGCGCLGCMILMGIIILLIVVPLASIGVLGVLAIIANIIEFIGGLFTGETHLSDIGEWLKPDETEPVTTGIIAEIPEEKEENVTEHYSYDEYVDIEGIVTEAIKEIEAEDRVEELIKEKERMMTITIKGVEGKIVTLDAESIADVYGLKAEQYNDNTTDYIDLDGDVDERVGRYGTYVQDGVLMCFRSIGATHDIRKAIYFKNEYFEVGDKQEVVMSRIKQKPDYVNKGKNVTELGYRYDELLVALYFNKDGELYAVSWDYPL